MAVGKVKDAAGSSFIESAIDTTSNSASVYLHGPRDAAIDKVVDEAAAAGITLHIVDAPFSAAELDRNRSRIMERMQELGISRMGFDLNGGGSTVNFRNTGDLRAARQALADYEYRLGLGTVDAGDSPAIAALCMHHPGRPPSASATNSATRRTGDAEAFTDARTVAT